LKATRDLLFGVANSSWSALVGFAVVPLYLKFLGIEAYGLIGFFATTQALLQLLDMGLATTVNREVARFRALGHAQDAAPLLHTLSCIYWSIAAIIAILGYWVAPFVVAHWLNPVALTKESLQQSVTLLILVVACRWPIGLYQGVLMGAQRLSLSSALNMAMTTTSSVGAVLVLSFVSSTLQAFFVWQALVGLGYAVVMRAAAWRAIGGRISTRFDVEQIRRVWRFSAGVSGVTISAIVLMQSDKVLLSKILPLESFGSYTLAGVVASGLYILLTPTFNVIYPRLSALVAQGKEDDIARLYSLGTRLLTAVLFPVAAGAAVLSYEILRLWTGNPVIAQAASPVVSLFLIGTALNGAMHFPYALQLAYGRTRLPLLINAILLVTVVPLILVLATRYGAVGGAASWATLNLVYVIVGTFLTHRVLLRGMGLRWLTRDVIVPFAVSACVIGFFGSMLRTSGLGPGMILIMGAALVAVCSFALLASFTDVRQLFRTMLVKQAMA
jgi:O-antigen/teichoic acid export membrane protein